MTSKDPWSARKNLYSSPIREESASATSRSVKNRRGFFSFLWLFLRRTCTAVGAFVLISSFLVFWTFSSALKNVDAKRELPEKFVLFMDMDGNLGDLPKEAGLAGTFAGQGKTLKDFLDAIERARTDQRVQGIYARMEGGGYSLGHIQEIRAAIQKFRESSKFTYVYSSSYGDAGGMGHYYLALAFEQIWMQPMGVVAITGLNSEVPFLRNIMDKVGVEPQFFQRKEFKSAYESLTNSEISEQNRRMMEYLIKDIAETLGQDISKDLGITPEAFKALVDKGLFTADEALDAGLIHYADYADIMAKEINALATGDPDVEADYVSIDEYIRETKPSESIFSEDFIEQIAEKQSGSSKKKSEADEKPTIALIYAVGVIMPSDGHDSPSLFDDGIAAADSIGSALIDAAKDENVKAVVLRVDSPGGSPVASETILRAAQIVQEQGKQVIVSMGPTAASGGYWISAYADQIFVLPTTLTGSIGVVGGKFSAEQLWALLGVNWERIQWGANAGMWSLNTPFNESEAERINAMLDNVYDNFVQRVAIGRKMSAEQVDRIAGGRVWTGNSALKIGLADRIGGLNDALDYAAKQIGKQTRQDVQVVVMPKPLPPIQRFLNMLEGQVFAADVLRKQAQIIDTIQPFLAQMLVMQSPYAYSVYSPPAIRL